MSNSNYSQLFATPVAIIRDVLNDHSDVCGIARDVYKDYITTEKWSAVGSQQGGVATYWYDQDIVAKYRQLQTVYDQLQHHVDQYVNRITNDSKIEPVPVMSWLTYYDSNSFAMKHNHNFYYQDHTIQLLNVNAILYLQTQRGDRLDLYWPNNIMQTTSYKLNYSNKAASIALSDNQLVIIPAWVDHGVEATVREKQKIVMSVNYQYKVRETL